MTPAPTPAGEFRAFVRRHHPDVGGDPEIFRRGLAAFRAGRSPFEAVPTADDGRGPDARTDASPRWSIADDDPRLDAPIVAVSGHVVPRTLRAGRRWLGRAPLNPVRTRRVV
ncbi:hypothetical protein [Actinomycetospora sp. NBRC 106378]|uniref:hypothetical protein n=1 Tax=Actinomycetospora sp. NBRC 106378 TaxID=3032208 RepID=UPI0024A00422|nr:hypothetical protein [Actinomycetospora sp. NBRC 106378]GLZ54668.1 hypothetical protein Acsp07_42850 [Actinomycetospora sp. NBRC 106378]